MKNEAKVGALVISTLVLAGVFAWIIGIRNPFNQSLDFYVTYNFAGGIEVGSPVRVSGIKVGKVEKIEFFVPEGTPAGNVGIQEPGSDPFESAKAITPLRLKISVRK